MLTLSSLKCGESFVCRFFVYSFISSNVVNISLNVLHLHLSDNLQLVSEWLFIDQESIARSLQTSIILLLDVERRLNVVYSIIAAN